MCQFCLLNDPQNESLMDIACFNTDLHDGFCPLVSVAWDEHSMVQIRPLPQISLQRGFALCNGEWCKGERCTYAHGELEKMAWNHELNMMKRGRFYSILMIYVCKHYY